MILLVASTGGHLHQLHYLHRRVPTPTDQYHWVTFDTPQSRSLLRGTSHEFVPFVGGRDPKHVAVNFIEAQRIFSRNTIDAVISTGSAVALPFFLQAQARGVPAIYIESSARVEGPSLTGRLISRIPGVRLYTQHREWADRRWSYAGSVFDAFTPADGLTEKPPGEIRSVVVTLGTYRGFGFERLIERLLDILPPTVSVLWQTGDTDVSHFEIDAHESIPAHELRLAMETADVVVAHAGVGSALSALEAGKCPVLVPRRFAAGEHIDDHQREIASDLASRRLSVSSMVEDLTFELLQQASVRSIEVNRDPDDLAVRPILPKSRKRSKI